MATTTDGGQKWIAGTLPAGFGISSYSQLSCADALHCSVSSLIDIAVQNPPQCASLPQRQPPIVAPSTTTTPTSTPSVAVQRIAQIESAAATSANQKVTNGLSCNPSGQMLITDIASTTDGGLSWTPDPLTADVPQPQVSGCRARRTTSAGRPGPRPCLCRSETPSTEVRRWCSGRLTADLLGQGSLSACPRVRRTTTGSPTSASEQSTARRLVSVSPWDPGRRAPQHSDVRPHRNVWLIELAVRPADHFTSRSPALLNPEPFGPSDRFRNPNWRYIGATNWTNPNGLD